MFTWQWHTWWWRGTGTFYVYTAVADATVMRGTDTIYVYMAMADWVMMAREHWHNLCLHGSGRLGYEGQKALTQFMFPWQWQTWLWGPWSMDSLCLYGDDRLGYEGQGALTQFMFTWRWQTWLWGPGSTKFMFTWWWQTWLWGPGSTDTVYVYMAMADMVMRVREHWHNLCLHGDGRHGYNEALTQFMFIWQWQKQRLRLPVVHWDPDPWSDGVLHHAELGPHSGESHFPFIFAVLL